MIMIFLWYMGMRRPMTHHVWRAELAITLPFMIAQCFGKLNWNRNIFLNYGFRDYCNVSQMQDLRWTIWLGLVLEGVYYEKRGRRLVMGYRWYPWWNISWTTLIFKCSGQHRHLSHQPLPYLQPFPLFCFSCFFPYFYISLLGRPALFDPSEISSLFIVIKNLHHHSS